MFNILNIKPKYTIGSTVFYHFNSFSIIKAIVSEVAIDLSEDSHSYSYTITCGGGITHDVFESDLYSDPLLVVSKINQLIPSRILELEDEINTLNLKMDNVKKHHSKIKENEPHKQYNTVNFLGNEFRYFNKNDVVFVAIEHRFIELEASPVFKGSVKYVTGAIDTTATDLFYFIEPVTYDNAFDGYPSDNIFYTESEAFVFSEKKLRKLINHKKQDLKKIKNIPNITFK